MLSSFIPAEIPGRKKVVFYQMSTYQEGGEIVYESCDVKNEMGEKVGEIKIAHYKKPFEFYYLVSFHVLGSKQNLNKVEGEMGFGQSIVSTFGEFVKQNKALGVLYDDTSRQNSYDPKKYANKNIPNIYGSQGWKSVDMFDSKVDKEDLFLYHGGLKFIEYRVPEGTITEEEGLMLLDTFQKGKSH